MKVVIVEPSQAPYPKEIENDLKPMQSIVGDPIQTLYPFQEAVALVCHDEGKLNGLPLNRALRTEDGQLYDIISGTFFLCAAPPDSEQFESLTPEQIQHYLQLYQTPELFLHIDGKIMVLPMEDT